MTLFTTFHHDDFPNPRASFLQAASQHGHAGGCAAGGGEHPCLPAQLSAAAGRRRQGQELAPGSRSCPGNAYSSSVHAPCGCVFLVNLERLCFQLGGRIPVLDNLSELVLGAEGIPVRLEPLSRLEALVCDVQTWKESAAKTFLLKNSPFSLLEVSLG